MIELRKDIMPSDDTLTQLKNFQAQIDALDTFVKKSAKAKKMFPQKNTKANKTFKAIKKCLTALCNSTRRCVYCEDSVGDEVEHIYPKDLYPEKCFDWDNYVYACGPCNGPKNNKFAIFKDIDEIFVEVNPPRGTPASQPPSGVPVLINPRIEDPLKYAILDLSGTFQFFPLPGLSDHDKKRVAYTYNEVLKLNNEEREPLRQGRENAYSMYRARLFEYVSRKQANAPAAKLEKIIDGIKKENHPTVWKEMQRYYKLGKLAVVDSDLSDLFDQAPEALSW